MTKKTNQRFKIGSGSESEFNDLKVENSLLQSEITRLQQIIKNLENMNYTFEKRLQMLDNVTKDELRDANIKLTNENEEMKAMLEQLKDGADFLAILGQPMKKFKGITSILDLNSPQRPVKYPPFVL